MSATFDAEHDVYGLSRYASVQHREGVSIVDDPTGRARKVLKLTTLDSYTGPTSNPRTQVEPPLLLSPDEEYWFGFGLLLPTDWPTLPGGGWVAFAETFGPPYAGSSPFAISQRGDSLFALRNATYGYDAPWIRPITRGVWLDFAVHFRLSADPAAGFYELWLNDGGGWARQKLNGVKRLTMATLDAGNSNPGQQAPYLKNYRKAGAYQSATAYFAGHRIGPRLADVDPQSHV